MDQYQNLQYYINCDKVSNVLIYRSDIDSSHRFVEKDFETVCKQGTNYFAPNSTIYNR